MSESPTPSELERALPVEPVDASLRMRVQRAARASYEGTSERAGLVWQDALVPATLILTGIVYGTVLLVVAYQIVGFWLGHYSRILSIE